MPVTATESELLIARERGVVTLTLNRPHQYNALTSSLIDELQRAIDTLGSDRQVRVIVIGGAGKAFCAGHDLKEMKARREPRVIEDIFARFSQLMLTLTRIPQPVIARVHGFAFAAGCQLVAQCDLAVAAVTAQFATSGVKYGLFCSTPGVALARNLSRKTALEMLLTGEPIDARGALERGLLNRVVESDTLDEEIARLAQSILAKSPVAIGVGKRTFYEQVDAPLDRAYSVAAQAMANNMMSDDALEGIEAFAQKREPRWTGR
jgi:enoyl-CoA hydratase/carnithine racemase